MANARVRAAVAISAVGFVAIAGWEGFREEAYIPIAGDVPTIGFGHTAGVRLGDTVTVEQALTLLRGDVREAERGVLSCVKVPLSQGELDAYVSLAFNIGTGAFCGSTLVRKLNAGDYRGACEEIKRWHFSGGKSVPGLENRRQAEFEMCMESQ